MRTRARRGQTTRLVGRAGADGTISLRYEAVNRDHVLAGPPSELTYTYPLRDGTTRVHTGTGLGALGTARALHHDVLRLTAGGVA